VKKPKTDTETGKPSARSITFPATIPPMETAIKIHGDGGARVQIDIAESDLGAFLPAVVFRGRRMAVTFQDAEDA
jgi:hypothetical protein